jgi:Subtilase family
MAPVSPPTDLTDLTGKRAFMFSFLQRHLCLSLLVSFICPLMLAGEARPNHVKATVARYPWQLVPNATAPAASPAASLLPGLRGKVVEEYEAATLIEIHENDKEELKRRGNQKSILVTLREEFDKVFLNGKELDARKGKDALPPGHAADPPYPNNEQGTWLVQFVGPVKAEWLEAIKNVGIVPVQYVSLHAYMVGGRESAIRVVERLPFVQWTSQLHRFLKPSVGPRAETTVELWVELARTDETDDAVAALANLAVGEIHAANWSDSELRVEGVFRTADLDLILAEPLVMWVSERPTIGLSDERAILSLTDKQPGTGAGEYKNWLASICPLCTNLWTDGFYVGIADTGLDGGDPTKGPTNGTIIGETTASGLHRAELLNSRIRWGTSFERTDIAWTCASSEAGCPDTTNSKHDTSGHGTMVAGMAAGDPTASGGKDSGQFFWGLGVAPSAGVVVTKINVGRMVTVNSGQFDLPVTTVTRDALSRGAHWQNFSLNQYTKNNQTCSSYYDGAYTALSRDFDAAVIDGDATTTGTQPITLTVSAGNVSGQGTPLAGCTINRFHTLPPATAKNVIAVGGAENLRPGDPWLCLGARSDSFNNLSINAKHGTATPGWYKPDLIAVSSSIAAIYSSDQVTVAGNGRLGSRCGSSLLGTDSKAFEPIDDPTTYRGATGTSFAAPMALGAAVLASRRYNSTAGAASPSLVKAMLIAGATSMRGGKDRAGVTQWRPDHAPYAVGDRVIPRIPNGHVYEVEAICGDGRTPGSEPNPWPTNGELIQQWQEGYDGSPCYWIKWRDKGLEMEIAALPNGQQGFGRLHLQDVLSQSPARVYVDNQALNAQSEWSARYSVADMNLPVRIALAWSDPPAVPTASGSVLLNNLNLSVDVSQSGVCIGRYVGNKTDTNDSSTFYACGEGTEDTLNNAEIVRFTPTAERSTFTVRVAFPQGSGTQNFSLVVWNATGPPPAMPSNFAAVATSATQAQLTWTASPGATSYEVERAPTITGPFATVGCSQSGCSDTGLSAWTTYVYRMRAVSGTGKSEWTADPATTVNFTDPALTAGTTLIKAVHVTELRQAVSALRTATQLGSFSWSDPNLGPGTLIRAMHVDDLRSALGQARSILGLAALVFTDATLIPGMTTIKAVHINELRQGLP